MHCLRDPTRGGLATTLNELAKQSKVGIRIEDSSALLNVILVLAQNASFIIGVWAFGLRKYGAQMPIHSTNYQPRVITELCNGCGKCVKACKKRWPRSRSRSGCSAGR